MPYPALACFETPLLAWHDLALQDAAPAWSAPYRVQSPRLLLPLDGAVGCEVAAACVVSDPLTALWLTPAQTYRLRQPQPRQRSMVLQLRQHADLPWPRAQRALVAPVAQLQLARWRGLLLQQPVEDLAIEEGLLQWMQHLLGPGAGPVPAPHRAVERAREHLTAEPGRQQTLTQIAAAACCSPFHLARHFRRHFGCTPRQLRSNLTAPALP